MSDRDHDLVLFGATGFVGRLTARYLAENAPSGVRIALAGRSRDRLEAVRTALPDSAAGWSLLVADAADTAAMGALAASTRLVVTTVGPYVKYGVALVEACARAGTHYCDLTGEVLFVHDSIAANHEHAMATGARIVHACGFDSIPSDLGVLLTALAAREGGSELTRTRLAVRSMRGGWSGGTVDTARTQAMTMVAAPQTRRIVADPWALVDGPPPLRRAAGTGSPGGAGGAGGAGLVDRLRKISPVRQDPDNGHFTGPFFMASFNTRIVARSASLLGYGDAFRYSEFSDYGAGVKGAVTAGVVSAGLLALASGLALAPTRLVLDRLLPAPGEGPSEESMAAGRFRMDVTGTAADGRRYRTVVAAPYDPGYGGTAVMLGESALAMLQDEDLPDAAGVLTPATAIGLPLVERLRARGFTFETTTLTAATQDA